MNRPAPISVFSDQRRTKSTIWSRVSCGTQTPVRVPQAFFLARHAQPSIRPELRPSSGSSFAGMQSAPGQRNGWLAVSARRQPPRSRRIPSASVRRPSAGVPLHRTTSRWAPSPASAASGWRPSLLARIASVASSCVLSLGSRLPWRTADGGRAREVHAPESASEKVDVVLKRHAVSAAVSCHRGCASSREDPRSCRGRVGKK